MPKAVFFRVQRKLLNFGTAFLHRAGLVELGLNYRFMISTVNGLYLYDRGCIRRLVAGEFFGLATTDVPGEYFLAICSRNAAAKDYRGRVLRARFDGQKVEILGEMSLIREGREETALRIHQVRWHEGHLWIVNTMGNVLWKATRDGRIVGEWTETTFFSADVPGQHILSSPDYRHYNSVAFRDGLIYVLAHNSGGRDKSRRSYVVALDADLREVSRRENVGVGCHDLLWRGDDLWICDSGGYRLLRNYEPVWTTDRFLRGLTTRGSILILAGTDYEPNKVKRRLAGSVLYFVDGATFHVLHSLVFNTLGPIHDLLFLEDVPTDRPTRSDTGAAVRTGEGSPAGANRPDLPIVTP